MFGRTQNSQDITARIPGLRNIYNILLLTTCCTDRFHTQNKEVSHKWGHVSSVHLASCDLLLRRRHDADVEGLGAAGAGAHHSRQRHGAVLHLPGPVKLLLQDGGSGKTHPTQRHSSCKSCSVSSSSSSRVLNCISQHLEKLESLMVFLSVF